MNSVEKALSITSRFEGILGYSSVGGNFDGMGLSFGLFQWNAGQGTLQPILRQCIENMPKTVEGIFTTEGFTTLKHALRSDRAFFEWTISINDRNKKIINPWYERFYKLGLSGGCQKFQQQATLPYLKRAKNIMRIAGLDFTTERAFALAFDITIQNGSIVEAAQEEYDAKVKPGMKEKDKLFILANAVANSSRKKVLRYIKGKPWTIQDDVRSRKLCIVTGLGEVHGRKYDLAKEYALGDGPVNYGDFAL
jgi:hypothetical protein